MKWRYFIGASILVAGLLLRFGAPLESVVLGLAAAAVIGTRLSRRTPC